MATSLSQPGNDGKEVARYPNVAEQPMKLSAWSTSGTFTGVEKEQVDNRLPLTGSNETTTGTTSRERGMVPMHLQQLFEAARGSCNGPQKSKFARLLTEYSTVFSTGRKLHCSGGAQHFDDGEDPTYLCLCRRRRPKQNGKSKICYGKG